MADLATFSPIQISANFSKPLRKLNYRQRPKHFLWIKDIHLNFVRILYFFISLRVKMKFVIYFQIVNFVDESSG